MLVQKWCFINSPSIWAAFVRNFATKNFQKSPNLVTLTSAVEAVQEKVCFFYFEFLKLTAREIEIFKANDLEDRREMTREG